MKRFFSVLKKYFDDIFYSSLQTKLAVLSFLVGSVMCLLCVFWIPPPGEISTSAIQATGMFLVLAGAAAGVKVAFDLQTQKFEGQLAEMSKRIDRRKHKDDDDSVDGDKNLF
jgi:hypothetical protein